MREMKAYLFTKISLTVSPYIENVITPLQCLELRFLSDFLRAVPDGFLSNSLFQQSFQSSAKLDWKLDRYLTVNQI